MLAAAHTGTHTLEPDSGDRFELWPYQVPARAVWGVACPAKPQHCLLWRGENILIGTSLGCYKVNQTKDIKELRKPGNPTQMLPIRAAYTYMCTDRDKTLFLADVWYK